MRIPINDNYSEKLTPYFQKAFQFLGQSVFSLQASYCAFMLSPLFLQFFGMEVLK